jgi:hypothetical protein
MLPRCLAIDRVCEQGVDRFVYLHELNPTSCQRKSVTTSILLTDLLTDGAA